MRYGGEGMRGSDATDCDMFGTLQKPSNASSRWCLPQNCAAAPGDDTCQYSADGECDDVTFGGNNLRDAGTDATDCRAMALGGEDSCRWANDNECDEPGIGTDNCTSGTDVIVPLYAICANRTGHLRHRL
jgi:protease YdgD